MCVERCLPRCEYERWCLEAGIPKSSGSGASETDGMTPLLGSNADVCVKFESLTRRV